MQNKFYKIFVDTENNHLIELGIAKMLEVFESASESDFNDYIDYLMKNNEKEKFETFLYYLLLFRENIHVQSLLNMTNTPISVIENLILFSYGYITHKGGSADDIFDDLLNFLSNDKILELLLNSEIVFNDKLMLFYLLTKLDIKRIDEFFNKSENIKKTINSFMFLSDSSIYNILHRNIDLFNFITSMLPIYIEEEKLEKFNEKFSSEISAINKITDMIKTINNKSNTNNSDNNFDLTRISMIISLFENNNLSVDTLEFFSKDKIFNSEFERLLFYEIKTNQMYKDTFEKIKNTKYFETEDPIIF